MILSNEYLVLAYVYTILGYIGLHPRGVGTHSYATLFLIEHFGAWSSRKVFYYKSIFQERKN